MRSPIIPVSQWWQVVSREEAVIYLGLLFTAGSVLYTCYRLVRWAVSVA